MFWFRFHLLIFCLGFLCVSCGLRPLYGDFNDRPIDDLFAIGIHIEAEDDLIAPLVQRRLARFFEKGQQYRLRLKVVLTQKNALISSQGFISRQNLIADAYFDLYEGKKKKPLLSDKVSASVFYNRKRESYLSYVTARRKARTQVLDGLALLIQQRLVVFLKKQQRSIVR